MKVTIDSIKHLIDEWGYGVLKKDINEKQNTIFEKLVKENYFTETSLGYLSTLKTSYVLGLGNKNSSKVVNLRAKKVKIWSFSELDQWAGCPLSYKLQRIDKIPQEHSSYALYGSLAHDIQENYILGKIEYKNMLKEFKLRLNRLKQLGAVLPKDSRGGTTIQENYEKSIKDYFKHNFTDMKNKEKYRVEIEVFNHINDNYIVGFIDLLKINRKVGNIFYCDILDFKTSTMYSKKEMKERARQLLLYKYLLEKSFPTIKIENIGWDFMKYVKIIYNNKVHVKQRKDNYLEFFKDKLIDSFGEENKEIIEKVIRIKTIPEDWQNVIKIENCYIYYPYTQEDVDEIIDFVDNTVSQVNNGIKNNSFQPRNYEEESFFCNNLCGVKKECPHLISLGVNKELKTSKETIQDILRKAKERMKGINGK